MVDRFFGGLSGGEVVLVVVGVVLVVVGIDIGGSVCILVVWCGVFGMVFILGWLSLVGSRDD